MMFSFEYVIDPEDCNIEEDPQEDFFWGKYVT